MKYLKPVSYAMDVGATAAVCYFVTGRVWPSIVIAMFFVAKQTIFNHYLQIGLMNTIRKLRGTYPRG